VTPRPGTPSRKCKSDRRGDRQLQREAPSDHRVQRALNQIEASFYNRMERVGGSAARPIS
jgi:hypothetical protein